ncbi:MULTISPECIES: hypothetical protein [Rhizobium]|uniref:Uncharacterized protein n=1 Tax=Rhizobium paranaense TaxID=1650438 RepID=A0A7W8XW97_9HYPH|nr:MULTISPECIES: hypothetical protein [Rhizobium]MBB5576760.1 hypothetical protein [Rhizobium paranaense]PST64922.1 hypothetical protein C9E91_01285 [Rhizobium sp. SEMIA4064]
MALKGGALSAVIIIALLVGANFLFKEDPTPSQQKLSASEQLCVNAAAEIFKQTIAADAQRANESVNVLEKLPSSTQNPAEFASIIASMNARDVQAEINEDAAYCEKLASCFSQVDHQKRFNACFGEAQRQRASDKN